MLPRVFAEAIETDDTRTQQAVRNALRRSLRDNSNPFDIPTTEFQRLYRMSKEIALKLLMLTEEQLAGTIETAVPPLIKLFIGLHFFAHGSYQRSGGQNFCHPVSQSTVSRVITKVTEALITLSPQYIRWPVTAEERQNVQARWVPLMGMPGILGAIDCTHIHIAKPWEREEAFFNYKGFHSLNVQMVCDAQLRIMNVRIGAGATNDKTIWRSSELKDHLEHLRQDRGIREREGKFYIIGDGGYTPSPILLTPYYEAVEGSPEAYYTRRFVQARLLIEQTFGRMKERWRCLSKERTLHYSPFKAGQITRAVAILYNFQLMHGVPYPADRAVANDHIGENIDDIPLNYDAGVEERLEIIRRYFTLREDR